MYQRMLTAVGFRQESYLPAVQKLLDSKAIKRKEELRVTIGTHSFDAYSAHLPPLMHMMEVLQCSDCFAVEIPSLTPEQFTLHRLDVLTTPKCARCWHHSGYFFVVTTGNAFYGGQDICQRCISAMDSR